MSYLLGFSKRNKKIIAGTLLLILLQSIGTLLVPFLVARMVDEGIVSGQIEELLLIGGQMLGIALITGACAIAASYYSGEIAARFGSDIRKDFFKKVQKLSIKEVDELGTPTLLARTTSDVTNIQQIIMMFLQMILPAPFLCIASIVLTGMISVKLMLIPFLAILVFLLVSWVVIAKAEPKAHVMQVRMDKMLQVLREFYTGAKVIRAFGNETYEKERTDKTFTSYAEVMIQVNRLFAILNPTVVFVMGASLVAVVFFGGFAVVTAEMQVGGILAIAEYTIISLGYLTMAAMVVVMIPRALASLERLTEVLAIDVDIKDGEKVVTPSSSKEPLLRFNQVSFSYAEAEDPVLDDLSFDIYAGKVTAIVGGTGSGKSTIAKAMLRFKDSTSGEIRLFGESIKNLSQEFLREQISYIPQKAFLFSGTIEDNLRFGKPEATMAELDFASQVAQAKPFIDSLPEGYQAPVSQKGSNFSGGQKQRLSIARALVKEAPIYFFDDSFSALDYQTDRNLRRSLQTHFQKAALIIVAQRISTVRDADQIIVLNDGKIAGIGTHDFLLETCKVYQEFARSQGIGGA